MKKQNMMVMGWFWLVASFWANSAYANNLPTVTYSVAGYEIQMEFLEKDQLRWTYLNAPKASEIGMSAVEDADIMKLRKGLYLMAWSEKSGAKIVDVFDFNKQKLYANYISKEGNRYKSEANFKPLD